MVLDYVLNKRNDFGQLNIAIFLQESFESIMFKNRNYTDDSKNAQENIVRSQSTTRNHYYPLIFIKVSLNLQN